MDALFKARCSGWKAWLRKPVLRALLTWLAFHRHEGSLLPGSGPTLPPPHIPVMSVAHRGFII